MDRLRLRLRSRWFTQQDPQVSTFKTIFQTNESSSNFFDFGHPPPFFLENI